MYWGEHCQELYEKIYEYDKKLHWATTVHLDEVSPNTTSVSLSEEEKKDNFKILFAPAREEDDKYLQEPRNVMKPLEDYLKEKLKG